MIGDALRRMRGEKHQDELAEEIGVSRGHLSRVENGRVDPRVSEVSRWISATHGTWAKVAEALGQPVQPGDLEGVAEMVAELLDTIRQKAGSRAKLLELTDEFVTEFWVALNGDPRVSDAARAAIVDALRMVEESWATDRTADSTDSYSRASSEG